MPLTLTWQEIALRLALSAVAGTLIGLDRGKRGRPAGLRTTLLVCLAAAVAMIQANLLLATVGKAADSFISLDLMRLPLGILTGMGFIGAGAVIRRDGLILGVTTAATLWFVTVIGLCFGGGQISLGIAGLLLGLIVVSGLHWIEPHDPRPTRHAEPDNRSRQADPTRNLWHGPEGWIQDQSFLGRLHLSVAAAPIRIPVAVADFAAETGCAAVLARTIQRSERASNPVEGFLSARGILAPLKGATDSVC